MKMFGVKGLAAAALVFGMLVMLGNNNSVAEDKKEEKKGAKKEAGKSLTTKQIMAAQNKLKGEVPKLVDAKKWDDVEAKAKAWVAAAEDLCKNSPKKGEADSWKELTGKYLEETKHLLEAAGKKDAEKAKAALAYLSDGKTCGGCHSKHK
jgi:hypothetical protein